MQRVQGDKTDPAVVDRPIGKCLQIREVPTPPIAIGTQTVYADRDPCSFAIPLEEFWLIGFIGTKDQTRFGVRLARTQFQPVISELRPGRQRQETLGKTLPIYGGPAVGGKVA